jgi:hypothetical protein
VEATALAGVAVEEEQVDDRVAQDHNSAGIETLGWDNRSPLAEMCQASHTEDNEVALVLPPPATSPDRKRILVAGDIRTAALEHIRDFEIHQQHPY